MVENILKDIKNKKFAPIYFLMGDEPYYIDQVVDAIEHTVLSEDEKSFNQHIVYGKDVSMAQVVGLAKQYPLGAPYSVVSVHEAQHLSKEMENLLAYAEQPSPQTILVFSYRDKLLDKRTKLFKQLGKVGVVLATKKMYDDKIPDWIAKQIVSKGFKASPKVSFILAEHLGNDLSKINNQLTKLSLILGDTKEITLEIVEEHVGISKDFNNFELQNALGQKDVKKCMQIAQYYGRNPSKHPLVLTIAILYNFFTKIIIYHTLADKNPKTVAAELKINPFFVKDYAQGARSFPLKKATRAISLIREADMKSKGVGAINITDDKVLMELLMKLFVL